MFRPATMAAVLLAGIPACGILNTSPDTITIAATVRLIDLEAGCWALDASNGNRYEPIDLPAGFRTDGRLVRVKLAFPANQSGRCQLGEVVLIVAIEDRSS